MKILVASHRFSPDIGGIETASATLATEFARVGHEVRLVTGTSAVDGLEWPFEVIRAPRPGGLLAQARWCEVFFQNNISLQTLWAAPLTRRPWVVAHQTWLVPTGARPGWHAGLKRFVLRFGGNVAISAAVAAHVARPCTVIGNPYRDDLFRAMPEVPREIDLVYLGRLVSDKGVDLLVEALAVLGAGGRRPRLTIVGSGPEEEALRALAAGRGVSAQITFAGAQTGEPLARLLNAHRIMVVPSRWAEPFGIVALEGLACGCVVVGSAAGGLPEAIGPGGVTFPNGDAAALAAVLGGLLADEARVTQLRAGTAAHLARHTARAVAQEYLRIFSRYAR